MSAALKPIPEVYYHEGSCKQNHYTKSKSDLEFF